MISLLNNHHPKIYVDPIYQALRSLKRSQGSNIHVASILVKACVLLFEI